jgi:hypothetical protein
MHEFEGGDTLGAIVGERTSCFDGRDFGIYQVFDLGGTFTLTDVTKPNLT